MDQKQLFRQMLEFNKAAFDNNFKAASLFQSQSEQYILRFLNQTNWLSEENKTLTMEWLNACRKNFEYFKTCADENYRKILIDLQDSRQQSKTGDKAK